MKNNHGSLFCLRNPSVKQEVGKVKVKSRVAYPTDPHLMRCQQEGESWGQHLGDERKGLRRAWWMHKQPMPQALSHGGGLLT